MLHAGVSPRRCARVGATAAQNDVRRSDTNADAYNKAMQAYSQTPFNYQHELGLCARPVNQLYWVSNCATYIFENRGQLCRLADSCFRVCVRCI